VRILFISNFYHPEPGAQPARVRNLTQRWANAGHDVTILVGVPNHPGGKVYPGHKLRALRVSYTEWDDKVRVCRISYFMRPNRGSLNRFLAFSSFTVIASLRAIFMKPYDVVVGTIPQPFGPLSAYLLRSLTKAKFVLDVRDLWPEGLTATGQATEDALAYKVIGASTSFLYKKADHIVAVTDGIRDSIIENHPVNPENVHMIRTAVDIEQFQSSDNPLPPSIREHIEGKFVVSYIGTMGNAHGLETVVESARILEHEYPRRFAFIIAGTGAEEQEIRDLAIEKNVTSLLCTGNLERDLIPTLLRRSNIGLASLRLSPIFLTVVPTKLYEYMAVGLPIVSNVAGEAEEFLSRTGAGITVEGDNPAAMAAGIIDLANDPVRLESTKTSGINFLQENVSWEASANAYLKVLNTAVNGTFKAPPTN
jgi:colanic acid biosynthesis glycosyl transferase WcaI